MLVDDEVTVHTAASSTDFMSFTIAPVVARLGWYPLRAVKIARLLQVVVPISTTFAIPFYGRPVSAEDDFSRSSVPP
jgi:hypothetical protein